MKIKVESEKIIKAVKKLDGIEIVLESPDDAKQAINLILRKKHLFKNADYEKLKDVNVTSFQKYETSAVDYKIIFLLEFLFEFLEALPVAVEAWWRHGCGLSWSYGKNTVRPWPPQPKPPPRPRRPMPRSPRWQP